MFSKIIEHTTLRQFVKFCLIGAVNTIVDFVIYFVLTRIFGLYFIVANVIAVFTAMTGSFIFNKYWTFRNKDSNHKIQFLKFTLVNLVYFIINNAVVFGLVHYFQSGDLAAKVVATAIGMFWNFGANKFWTFRQ